MMNIQRFAAAEGKVISVMNSIECITSKLVAVNVADGIKFDVSKYKNGRIMFIFDNTDTTATHDYDVKVLKPANGSYAAASADLVFQKLGDNERAVAFVETAKYADNKGIITLKGENAAVKCVAIYLG